MMAIFLLHLPRTYTGLFLKHGLLDCFCVVEHCILVPADHALFILLILHRTRSTDLPRFIAVLSCFDVLHYNVPYIYLSIIGVY